MSNPVDRYDGFNWRWLYFAARYILRFSEEEFWSMTPRKLAAFSCEYTEYKQKSEGDYEEAPASQGPKAAYIDQLF